MLELLCLCVDFAPIHAKNFDEEEFEYSMPPYDMDRLVAPLFCEFYAVVRAMFNESRLGK